MKCTTQACQEARNPLFWTTAALTLMWFVDALSHFFGWNFPEIPAKDVVNELYFTFLAAYVGVKHVSRIADKESFKPKRGELFFYGWAGIAILIAGLGMFHVGHPAEVLREIWPDPLRFVILLFVAGEVAKGGGPLFQAVRNALANNSEGPGDQKAPTTPTPPAS